MRLALRSLAALALAAHAAGGAAGEAGPSWTQVAADNGIFTAYADRGTIRREGASTFMRGMYDFRRGDLTPEGHLFHSTTVEREYDCAGRRVRLLAYEDHAQRFGEGPVVGSARSVRRWEEIVEGSVDSAFLALACSPD